MPVEQTHRLLGCERLARDPARTPRAQEAVEGLVDRGHDTQIDQRAGHMRSADRALVCLRQDRVAIQRKARILQPFDHGRDPPVPGRRELRQVLTQRGVVGIEAVAEHVHLGTPLRRRELDAGHQGDLLLAGTRDRRREPVDRVVVGDRDHLHLARGGEIDKLDR